jgi:hypothetical protein
MQRKPWPIIILTIIFTLIPFSNLLTTYFIIQDDVSFYHYLYSLVMVPSNHIRVFHLIAPPMIATYAIYSVKKWSYSLLVVSVLWVFANSAKNIGSDLNTIQIIFSMVMPLGFGLFVLGYFLTPSVRRTYFDPNLKWWEAKPRYIVDIPFKIKSESKDIQAQIKNVSEGGVLIESPDSFERDEQFEMAFTIEGYDLKTQAKIIFKNPNNEEYGVQFMNKNESFFNQMADSIRLLKENNVKRSREPIPWKSDFLEWYQKLIKTGKGLTPEIPNHQRKSKD